MPERGQSSWDSHFPLLVALCLFVLSSMPYVLRETITELKECAPNCSLPQSGMQFSSSCLLSISLPSVFSFVFFLLFLWSWHHGITEYRVSGRAHRPRWSPVPVSYLFGCISCLSTCHCCILTLELYRDGTFLLPFINGLTPSPLKSAWHITGIYQHLLNGCIEGGKKLRAFWVHLIRNQAILFVLYFNTMHTYIYKAILSYNRAQPFVIYYSLG